MWFTDFSILPVCDTLQGSSCHPFKQGLHYRATDCGSKQLSWKQPMVRCLNKSVPLILCSVWILNISLFIVFFPVLKQNCVCLSHWAMETKTSRKISVSRIHFETTWLIIWIKIINTSMLFVNVFSEICSVSLPHQAIKYRVEADMLRRSPRVRFKDGNGDIKFGSLSLPSSKTKCETLKLYVLVRFWAWQL